MSEQINEFVNNDTIIENGITSEGLKNEIERVANILNKPSDLLNKIIMTAEKIKKIKEKEIRFSDPILWQNDNAIIFPHTINVIQGQAGVHKSRLAEFICAAMLKLNGFNNELLGY